MEMTSLRCFGERVSRGSRKTFFSLSRRIFPALMMVGGIDLALSPESKATRMAKMELPQSF